VVREQSEFKVNQEPPEVLAIRDPLDKRDSREHREMLGTEG